MPRILLLAAVLAAERVSCVLVGGAALWLRGEDVAVADVDAVPEPGADNLARLHAALTTLAVRHRLVPPPGSLSVLDMVTVPISYGKVMRAKLRDLTGVAVQAQAAFPAPLARMLRSWVDGHRDEDIAASIGALGSAIGPDRAVG